MNRHYHITLDSVLSDFVEAQRKGGKGAKEVFVAALEAYRSGIEKRELEELLERGYAESAEEDLEILREFDAADHEAEVEEVGRGGARKRVPGPARSGRGK